jgi:DNA polymerase-1
LINDLSPLLPSRGGAEASARAVPAVIPGAAQLGRADLKNGVALPEMPLPAFELVQDERHAARVCAFLADEPLVALDVETYATVVPRDKKDKPALDPFRNEVRLVQLAVDCEKAFLFDLLKLGGLPASLRGLLTEPATAFVGFNLAFDVRCLLHHFGVAFANPIDLFAGTVLAEGYLGYGHGTHRLAAVVARYLGYAIDKSEQVSDWSRPDLTANQLQYAAVDAVVLPLLYDVISAVVETTGTSMAWQIENHIIVPLALVGLAGIRLDRGRVKKLIRRWDKEAVKIGAQALIELGPDVDLDSPKQLRTAFSERFGVHLVKTDASTLKAYATDIPTASAVLEYRQRAKLRMTYGSIWLEKARIDGRIHPTFSSMGAHTGRMSCRDPNLQGIPRNAAVRACFVPSPGHVFIIADYNAIELRVIAQLIGDEELLRCFCSDPPIDPHRRTAAHVLNKPIEAVTKEDRTLAKPINFGFAFSLGAKNFVPYARDKYGIEFSLSEAMEFRQKFFGLYHGIRAWHQRARFEGPRLMKATTASGRFRLFDEFKYAWFLNSGIQGTAADGMKRAIALLYPQLISLKAQIVNVIHDELVVETPSDSAAETKAVVNDGMVEGMKEFLPDIPVIVEAVISDCWSKP